MKYISEQPGNLSDRALEFIMRDVFDGLIEVTLESAYRSAASGFEVIQVTPEVLQSKQQTDSHQAANEGQTADIIPFVPSRRADG